MRIYALLRGSNRKEHQVNIGHVILLSVLVFLLVCSLLMLTLKCLCFGVSSVFNDYFPTLAEVIGVLDSTIVKI